MSAGSKNLFAAISKLPESQAKGYMLARFELGIYHDYKSTLQSPKHELVMDANKFGFKGIAKMAQEGIFDDEPDEEDMALIEETIFKKDPDEPVH